MSTPTEVNQAKQSDVLQIVNASLWPVCLIVCIALFRDPLSSLISEVAKAINNPDTKTIAVTRNGVELTRLANNAKENLEVVQSRLSSLEASLNEGKINESELRKNILSLKHQTTLATNNIDQGLQSIKQAQVASNPVSEQEAAHQETLGFQALLNKDLNGALTAFSKSEEAKPGYNNAYELKKFLSAKQLSVSEKPTLLNDNLFWTDIYRSVINQYSWKMPVQLKTLMKQRV